MPLARRGLIRALGFFLKSLRKMLLQIHMNKAGIWPLFGDIEFDPLIETWVEAQNVFVNYRLESASSEGTNYKITLDTSGVIQHLRYVRSVDESTLLEDWENRPKCILNITIDSLDNSKIEQPPFSLIELFMQNFFLAMNISVPDGCNLYGSSYLGFENSRFIPPKLSSSALAAAWLEKKSWGWPQIERIPLESTWRWLAKIGLPKIYLADTPSQKIAFALLDICSREMISPEWPVLITQVLENLFAVPHEGIVPVLRERIALVLGVPESNKKWLSKFYDLRSRAAHGDLPLIRPKIGFPDEISGYLLTYVKPIDQAVAVLWSLLQDMIIHDSDGYEFSQQMQYKIFA